MGYLEEFQARIRKQNFRYFFDLWEEYCTGSESDPEEFLKILDSIKNSEFASIFGKFADTALPLWQTVTDKEYSYKILKLLLDIQTTNAPVLAETALLALKERYGNDPKFQERIRLVGLRTKERFEKALSNFELLTHLEPGQFVYHAKGWGTGEVEDVSMIRETVTIDFEHVTGLKHLTFQNAFKILVPLERDHLFVHRFIDVDDLEKKAKKDPVGMIKKILKDTGPKTSHEIKEEFSGWVIPEEEWSKWWQRAKAGLKREMEVECPKISSRPFRLRSKEASQVEVIPTFLFDKKKSVEGLIQSSYRWVRDHPLLIRDKEVKEYLKNQFCNLLEEKELLPSQKLATFIFLELILKSPVEENILRSVIKKIEKIEDVVEEISIGAFKKRVLVWFKKFSKNWAEIFSSLLLRVKENFLREYLFEELDSLSDKKAVSQAVENLLNHPIKYPETFLWYFQKILGKGGDGYPFGNKEGRLAFFENLLILLHAIEGRLDKRPLSKKMVQFLFQKRYAVVRELFKEAGVELAKELLLLISKCHSFSNHDKKILYSLVEVVHPSLSSSRRQRSKREESILWTTQQGYQQVQEKIKKISTIELIENSKEVEAARALGDLRENAEYKFAVEKRAYLQHELKILSEQLHRACIINKRDIATDEVGIGCLVIFSNSKGKKASYAILGPWDAAPEKGIISFQSQFAEAMVGKKRGEFFNYQSQRYQIREIENYLESK